jgi:hypothetical protein
LENVCNSILYLLPVLLIFTCCFFSQKIPERDKNGKITSQNLVVWEGSIADPIPIKNVTMPGDEQTSFKIRLKSDEDYTVMLTAGTKNGTNMSLEPSVLHIQGSKGQ